MPPERSDVRRIGVLTGGGDAPGLNAVIRAVVKAAANCNCEVIGLEDSFDGLIEANRSRRLVPKDVTGILRVGGTILGTTNRGNPFLYPIETSGGTRDYSARCVEMFHEMKLDALVVIGGDGTLAIAHEFSKLGVPLVGVPKTIDNDIVETTNTFGFDTAVSFATDAIDRLHVTAEAHHRVIVVEVMGRYAGWIALYSGVAGGADVILIPEIPYDIEKVARRIRDRDHMGARFSIVVAAEGARPIGGKATLLKAAEGAWVERLGGVAALRRRRPRDADREGDPQRRARASAARRRADQLRPHPRDPLRRARGRAPDGREVRPHGGVPSARHCRRPAREAWSGGRGRSPPISTSSAPPARWGFLWRLRPIHDALM